ncbi:hypothetical protein A0256_05905 [Mucilaginibacter sp. PAMC 26640]|nr:hypothetical protein A0256_05905 [Mucilaginibacter sp. PAMC 26640]
MIFFVCLSLSNYSAFAQKTTIWFVRHAEKEAGTPQFANDANLSPDGLKRSEALAKMLKHEKIKAIYVTKFKRAGQTARPLAAQLKLLPRLYGDSVKMFAAAVLKNFRGSKLVVIGHSNTLMPLLGAFGSKVPFETLDDDDYDMVFKLTIQDSGERQLEISYYGMLHHQSELPQKYKEDNRPVQQFIAPATHY